MKTKRIILNILIFGFLLLPLILWFVWLFSRSHELKVLIVDKTVLTKECREHCSFNWILKHDRYTKSDGSFYETDIDYKGFFPLENDQYKISDLQKMSNKQIDSLSKQLDAVYYTDTYGIYYNEWYRNRLINEHSEKIYGGLDEQDYLLLKAMKEKKKLIVGEFNFFATPTAPEIRSKAEDLFNLSWTGWTGRYFYSLDTLENLELPHWVVRLYKEQHQGKWDFKKAGIVFVNKDETIAILEKNNDLVKEVPSIKSFNYGVEKYGIPPKIDYPYWFEITLNTDTSNRVISYFEINPTKNGDSILQHHKIPKIFPASIEHFHGYPFYYFCADFCDVPIDDRFIQLAGINYFQLFVTDENDKNDRRIFFWRYYYPFMKKVLSDYNTKRK